MRFCPSNVVFSADVQRYWGTSLQQEHPWPEAFDGLLRKGYQQGPGIPVTVG
jgi:hypothetical protein